LLRKRIRADLITDRIVGEAFAVLDVTERAEVVRLLAGAVERCRIPTNEFPTVGQNR
jgi:hypothetical protein